MSQRMEALARANAIRSYRGRLKRDVFARGTDGVDHCAVLIGRPPPEILTMRASELVQACKAWGPARTHRVFRRVGVTERTTLGELTDRQREALVRDLSNLSAWQEYRSKVAV